jgi:GntR family transcriptional regulator
MRQTQGNFRRSWNSMADDQDIIAQLRNAIVPERRTPRYEQLEAALDAAIADGRLAPGAVLPREPDLAAGLGLSRQTVGRALNDLAERGLVIRRRGVGTFIAPRRVEQPLDRLYSFVHTLASSGQPPVAQLLGVRLTADDAASPLLTGAAGGLVVEIGRLFYFDDVPVVVEHAFLPVEYGQRLPLDRLADGVIDDLLRELCGIDIDRGEEILSMTALPKSTAAILRLRSGAPAFSIVRTAYAGARVMQMRRSLIRGDRARFRVKLAGPNLKLVTAEVAQRLDAS